MSQEQWVAPTPITWQQASTWINDGSTVELGRLQRSAEQLQQYLAFREQLLQEWASVPDYMKTQLYDCDITENEDGKKCAEVCNYVVQQQEPVIRWRANDFPYNFEPGVAHHLLWASKPLPPETITSIIQEQLPFHETLWWINPPELQSIQALWHCHVLSRATSTGV